MRLVTHRQTAVGFVGRDAEETGVAEGLPHVRREGIGFVGFGGEGLGKGTPDEFLHALAELGEVGGGGGSEAGGVFVVGGVAALGLDVVEG